MAKKTTPRREGYREIIEKIGYRMEDCRIVAYGFEKDEQISQFHFALMLDDDCEYRLFDQIDGVAQVIIPNTDEMQEICDRIAKDCGGKPTNPKLL